MSHSQHRSDPGLGWMFACSATLHLALCFFLVTFHVSSRLFTNAPVYYVDVVNLPVADPQAGAPSPPGSVPPMPAPAPARQEMKLPAKAPAKAGQKPAKLPPPHPAKLAGQKPVAPGETAEQFEERMAKLEQQIESRHQLEAMEAMRKKLAAAGSGKGEKVGTPGGKGAEAGSDYAGYIRSRLEDAFRLEDRFKPDQNKMAIVRLAIDKNGRIVSQRFERRSGDKLFDDAVARTVARAEREFKPPPDGGQFEHGFVFKPQGVGKK